MSTIIDYVNDTLTNNLQSCQELEFLNNKINDYLSFLDSKINKHTNLVVDDHRWLKFRT